MRYRQSSAQTIFIFFLMAVASFTISAQTTEFTYQGKLLDGGLPANANYDMQFQLFDDSASGSQQGQTVTVSGVTVTGGVFTVHLDFGTQFSGDARFLQIGVKPAGNPAAFVDLNPRQPLTSAPYSIRSLNASKADLATNSTQLGGIPSTGFVHNGTTPQTGTSFNIDGGGTLGGGLSAGTVNSASQYYISGNIVLSVAGQNTFVGLRAGQQTQLLCKTHSSVTWQANSRQPAAVIPSSAISPAIRTGTSAVIPSSATEPVNTRTAVGAILSSVTVRGA